jgi:hypothetical protein
MDGFEEKKWFVYLTDHHEGPFSVPEVEEMFSAGRVSSASFIWAEGMTDWKVMTDVPAFSAVLSRPKFSISEAPETPSMLLETAPTAGGETVTSFQAPTEPSTEPTKEPTLEISPENSSEEPGDASASLRLVPSPESEEPTATGLRAMSSSPSLEAGNTAAPSKTKAKGSSLKWVAVAILALGIPTAFFAGVFDPLFYPNPKLREVSQAVSDLSRPLKLVLLEKAPALGKWISLLPRLEDVSSEEYEDLKTAVSSRMENGGPRVAAALSKSDPLGPAFYVASNLPEGTVFDIYIEGTPDTLLNQLSFSSKAQATSLKGLGKSAAIKYPDGRPIPRGEYMIYVSLPGAQSLSLPATPVSTDKLPASVPRDIRILAKKSYFLGGPKDATYASRLKEFHDRVKSRIAEELAELRQFHSTIEAQLNGTLWAFRPLPKQSFTTAKRKTWNDYDAQWAKLSTSLNDNLAKWNNPTAPEGFFYGNLFQLALQAAQEVQRLHELQKEFVAGKRAVEPKINEATTFAQTGLLNLKSKIEEVASAPLSAAGLPQPNAPAPVTATPPVPPIEGSIPTTAPTPTETTPATTSAAPAVAPAPEAPAGTPPAVAPAPAIAPPPPATPGAPSP